MSTAQKSTNPSSAVATITQKELQEYVDLHPIARRYSSLRAKLIDRLDQGATVEAGELTASIIRTEWNFATWGRLAELMGKEEFAKLREKYGAKAARRLWIEHRAARKAMIRKNLVGWEEEADYSI